MTATIGKQPAPRTGNTTIVVLCLVFVFSMLGMAYAAVPLYRLFCQVTGYNGTTQRVEQYSDTILDRKMRVTFDANISSGLNWDFASVEKSVEPRIGETIQVSFRATNRSPSPVTGTAVFNVTPMEAGAYFNKVECFCFTETTLQPGETLDMPVVFYVDPEIVKAPETQGLHTLTLSYTFYPSKTEKPVAALPREEAGAGRKL